MPVVSVVMAVKNGEATLLRSVNSILSQSFTDFEFIIADDNSTDNTLNILRELSDSRVLLLNSPDKGLVNTLNFCLEHTRGKYIARMDADDYAYPYKLQKQVQLLDKEPDIGVVSGIVNHISTETKQEGYSYHVKEINKLIEPYEHFANRFKDSPVANPSVLFRASLIKQFGNYQDDGPEDYEFWLRLLHNGVKFKKIAQPVIDWYDYNFRLTRTNKNYSIEAFYKIKAQYFALWWTKKNLTKKIWVWGYGKEVFNKSKWLQEEGVEIEGYIDIKERFNPNRKVIHYSKVEKDNMFVLVYVGDRNGKQNIKSWLDKNAFMVVKEYYFMS